MRYIYISAGRKFWFDLALELKRSHGHDPVFWYGDERLSSFFSEEFEGCHIYKGQPRLHGSVDLLVRVLHSSDFFWIKDEAIKMIDRLDSHDLWGRKVRENLFYSKLLEACSVVEKVQADFLLMSESPHDLFSYLIWRVCRISGLPSLHFEAVSISPAIVMVSAESGELKKVPRLDGVLEPELDSILDEARRYFERYDKGAPPGYMSLQEDKESIHFSLLRRARDLLLGFFPLPYAIFYKEYPILRGYFYGVVERRLKLWGRIKTLALRRSYSESARVDVGGGKFLYFPLHYEPERTTSPDGGIYYDQMRAALELRARLPSDIALVIKEHPSQLFVNMRGYRGRDKCFYEVLSRVEGVMLAPLDFSSKELIARSIGVVTVTGTAALEAVFSGRPALVLGSAWFMGVPGVYRMDDFPDFIAAAHDGKTFAVARQWVMDYLHKYSFFGCVNPSNEKYYSSLSEKLRVQWTSPVAAQIDGYLSWRLQELNAARDGGKN